MIATLDFRPYPQWLIAAANVAMEDDGVPWSGEDPASSEDEAVESDQAETLSDGTTYLDWLSPFGFPASLMEDPRHRGMFPLTLASAHVLSSM